MPTVAIAGAGIAGLAAASAFALRGWEVRLFERAPEPRTFGAGIYMFENGLRVLEAIGAYDAATAGAIPGWRRRAVDHHGGVIRNQLIGPDARLFTLVRKDLLDALLARAQALGVVPTFGVSSTGATPDGGLLLSDGRRIAADLVIGADGINSPVRASLGLLRRRRKLHQYAVRMLIPRRPEELLTETGRGHCEFWHGRHRLLYAPCTATHAYVQCTAPIDDARGMASPLDRAHWRALFPAASWIIDRLPAEGRGDRFEHLSLHEWSQGRVAVLGDAAHAQPPNLGQGGGCSLMNALALAAACDGARAIPSALQLWERRVRPLTARTQNVALLYGWLNEAPPRLRSAVFRVIEGNAWLKNRTVLAAARHDPIGAA